jgi:GPH family glycoside/pentoside/hexuronide:cation symporter
MSTLKEKIGYGFGDMSSSMFWKIFSAYLPFFYANVFHLSLVATGVLMLVTRIWDAVSDPIMGIIADRTQTRWGKYRPYLLWISVPFAVAGVLLFTVPDIGQTGKTVWAFVTYILMMTVYTAINVPYGSMLGVMTDDPDEKTVFSSFRMFFAYGGSFIILFSWEPLCNYISTLLGTRNPAESITLDHNSWFYAMIIVGIVCALLFVLTFLMTREHITTAPKSTSVGEDLKSLFGNAPWWILLGGVLFFNFFNAIRYAAIPFYFSSLIAADAHLSIFGWEFLFYAGIFLAVGEVANMIGVTATAPLCSAIGKKSTFIVSLAVLILLCIPFYFIPTHGASAYWIMMTLQILICIFTGVVSPLVWSMYADIADYAELKFHTVSTGLIFSSSSMAQKFGGAFGGAAVTWILAAFGFATGTSVQSAEALNGIKLLMSFIPAAIAVISLVFLFFYPLTTKRMKHIVEELKDARR